MRVLIIGGSRFIGAWLTRRLAQAGHAVTLFNRGQTQPPFALDAARLTGDLSAIDDHAAALRALDPDVVVHMMLTGAQSAWDLARLFAGTRARAVAISSTDVYRSYDRLLGRDTGPSIRDALHEDAPLRRKLYPYRQDTPEAPEDADGWALLRRQSDYDKIPAELMVREAFKARGTILRLPAVYGPGDFQHRLYGTVKRIDDGRPVILMDEQMADWRWSLGYVGNVAEAIALAIEQPGAAAGRTYNVGDSPVPTAAEWTRQIGRQLGWGGRIVAVPRAVLPEGIRPEEDFSHPMVLDTTRIRRELGYTEVVSAADAIAATAAWERSSPPEQWADPFDYDAEDAAVAAASASSTSGTRESSQ